VGHFAVQIAKSYGAEVTGVCSSANVDMVRSLGADHVIVPNHADLVVLKELVEAGKLDPVIGQTYKLEETASALRHIDGGHARGKVVVNIVAA
jgi:NADPH:quinone reductase-like Zn-dependent oxidoreductase